MEQVLHYSLWMNQEEQQIPTNDKISDGYIEWRERKRERENQINAKINHNKSRGNHQVFMDNNS